MKLNRLDDDRRFILRGIYGKKEVRILQQQIRFRISIVERFGGLVETFVISRATKPLLQCHSTPRAAVL
ncbi:hypothetical protein BY996DRAFT_6538245 [Phakopsora pachyrhizi]|nr:hypothetical protein BY996DRAFT_6538245 [Phakopsora pachyrhizi]